MVVAAQDGPVLVPARGAAFGNHAGCRAGDVMRAQEPGSRYGRALGGRLGIAAGPAGIMAGERIRKRRRATCSEVRTSSSIFLRLKPVRPAFGRERPLPTRCGPLAKDEPSGGDEQHGDRDASDYPDRSAGVRCFVEQADRSAWVDL